MSAQLQTEKGRIILYEACAALQEALQTVLNSLYRTIPVIQLPALPALHPDAYYVFAQIQQDHPSLSVLLLSAQFSVEQQLEALHLPTRAFRKAVLLLKAIGKSNHLLQSYLVAIENAHS